MKKKVFITLLVLFISLAIFAQGGNEQTGRPTIDVLTWGGADRLGYLKTIYEETTDLSGDDVADIVFTSGGTGATDAYQLFRLQLASNSAPDILFFGGETAATEFILNGDIRDITDDVSDHVDDIIPAALVLSSYEGRIYGIPTQVKSKVWFYRAYGSTGPIFSKRRE